MSTGKFKKRGIRDRAIGETAGIRPFKFDIVYASETAFLAAKSEKGEGSSSAEEGDWFYDSTTNSIKVHNGTQWEEYLSASSMTGDVTVSAAGVSTIGAAKVDPDMVAKPRVRVYREAIAVASFTDGGAASGTLNLSEDIPAGARFLYCLIDGIVGFAGDTSAVITVGDGSDVDRYNTGTPNVFATAAAGVDMGVPSGTAFHSAAKTPVVTITGASDFSAIVTDGNGAANITLVYIEPV